ncbi:MAG TPA: response regulator transcription factor [Chloroflexota bacterium]|jgi:DNA-binding response OmpR family regulator|nr:response regulator transcription factor [Chloroflexota bacterium]
MKILVVDDDPHMREALAISLELHWQDATILAARDGEEGLRLFAEHDPDVVLLDVSMPGKDGFAVLREVRQSSDVPVLMLTARGEETAQVRGLELGADDYVVKPFSHLALLARIKAVLRRAELPPPVRALPDFTAGDLAIHFQNQEVTVHGERVNLTPIEFKLLYHLVRNAGRVLPQQTLLDRVWGEDYDATSDYLKVYISRLRAKLERDSDIHYIETVRGLGYRFVRPKDSAGRC